MSEERLQKLLARAGISSRRAAEELIVKGRVSVDGKIIRELGVRADARRQRVEVDGRRIVAEPLVYYILNKPRGVMCTLSDPEGRETIKDLIRGIGARVVPVGRLDYHTSGALLLTNDGEFALKLQHPRGMVPKEYVAKVRGVLNEESVARFAQSIEIDGRRTQPADVRILRLEGDKTWLSITLREGKNRQVRRLGDESGFPVLRLSRLSQAGITTEGLRPGQWRALSRDELTDLKKTYGVPHRVRSPEPIDDRPPARRAPIRSGHAGATGGNRNRKAASGRSDARPPFEREASAPRGGSKPRFEREASAPRGGSKPRFEREANAPRGGSKPRFEREAPQVSRGGARAPSTRRGTSR